jgi:3-phosphoshikimate 1-carboxyvinyltransferase
VTARPLTARPATALEGDAAIPGDKSISHRALMFAGLAVGETTISGLLEGEDVIRTARAMQALGCEVARGEDGVWRVRGVGLGGLAEPDDVIDLGNSGTAARLFAGLLATHPLTVTLTGDASLRRRPMDRVTIPLERFGARFETRSGNRLPMAIIGAREPVPQVYELPVASAQVKSAVLLAGLNTPGRSTAIEPAPTRDHSERMLGAFGAEVVVEELGGGRRAVTVTGEPELAAARVTVPGDISSAAFPMVAAASLPGSRVTLRGVGLNPTRTGLIDTLREMGARLEIGEVRESGGEPFADIAIEGGALRGVTVPAERAPLMIDEYPALAAAAACAEGETVMEGLAELRVKESDRLAAIAAGLAACGVDAAIEDDTLRVAGAGGRPPGGGTVTTHMDHRIAMAFLVLGLLSEAGVTVDDTAMIETSFPGFAGLMTGLGAAFA